MKILLIGNQRKYRGRGRGYFGCWNEELFREELSRKADVCFYGWGYDPEWADGLSIVQIIRRFGKPDVLLTHYTTEKLNGFNEVGGILKANIAADYYEGCWKLPEYVKYYKEYKFDVVFGYSTNSIELLRRDRVGVAQYLLPFTSDVHIFRNLKLVKKYDVAAFYVLKDEVYPYRRRIQQTIKEMPIRSWIKRAWFDEAVIKINQSKICVNSNARFKFINPRVTEVLACGTFLLNDRNSDFAKLGYKDGHHMVLFDNLDDMKDKIKYFLRNDDEREEIAANGSKFVRENYNHSCRAEQLVSALKHHL